MPLKIGTTKETIGGNIGELLHKFKKTGSIGTSNPANMKKAKAQAAAIAFEKAGKSKKMSKPVKKAVKGFEKGGINPSKEEILNTPGGKKMSDQMKGIMERADDDRKKAMSSPGGKQMKEEMDDVMETASKRRGPEFRTKKAAKGKRMASNLFY